MKRPLLIALLVLPFAYVVGRMSVRDHARSRDDKADRELPAKSAERFSASREREDASVSEAWIRLRKRASAEPAELIQDLLVRGDISADNSLIDHLLSVDPEALFREIKLCRDWDLIYNVSRRWSLTDPLRALPLLLGDTKPFSLHDLPRRGGAASLSLDFSGIGRVDAEAGFELIRDLPVKRRIPEHYRELIKGIAGSSPEKSLAYFEKVAASASLEEDDMGDILRYVASADPAGALGWARARHNPIPTELLDSLIQGISSKDFEIALKLYEDAGDKRPKHAHEWILQQLPRKVENLNEICSWVDGNVPADNVKAWKAETLNEWADRHPEQAAELLLANPEMLVMSRSNPMTRFMQWIGKEAEVVALADRLPPEQGEPIRKALASPGHVMPGRELVRPEIAEVLTAMKKDPEAAEQEWQTLDAARRQELTKTLREDGTGFPDPALVVKRLGESPADLDGKGARAAIARLTLVDPRAAARIAESMPAGEARNRAIDCIHDNWAVDDATAAAAWQQHAKSAD